MILNSSFSIARKQGQEGIDSLLLELPKAKEDTNKVNLLCGLSSNYSNVNPDEGLKYGEQSLILAQKLNFERGIGKSYNYLGLNYYTKSKYTKALDNYLKALKINTDIDNKAGIATNLGNIGMIYYSKSDYPTALDYYFKALQIDEEIKLKGGIAKMYENIGLVYNKQSDFSKALEYFFKALKYNEELGNKKGVASNLGDIGFTYDGMDDFTKSLEYQTRAMKINEEIGSKTGIATNLKNIGDIYGDRNDYSKALEYFFKALKINEQIGNYDGFSENLGNIGEIYLKTYINPINTDEKNEFVSFNRKINLKKSIEYLLRAYELSKSIGDLSSLQEWCENLSIAYDSSGDYKTSMRYFKESVALKDTIYSHENQKKISFIEYNHQRAEMERNLQIEKLKLEHSKQEIIFLIVVFILLVAIILVIVLERSRTEKLLLNVLPKKIAKRLKGKEKYIADHFDEASIVFADIVEFTQISAGAAPERIVQVLDDIFTKFDKISEKYGLEKIKTIGDCYMAVAGVPEPNLNHAEAAANWALEVMEMMKDYKFKHHESSDNSNGDIPIKFRIGMHCGPVVAGVIGKKKFIYDLWGDTVNTASRMEENGVSGMIHVSNRFKETLSNTKTFQDRGEIVIKGKGTMRTWFLTIDEKNN